MFWRSKKRHYYIELYKVVDFQKASDFNITNFIEFLITHAETTQQLKVTRIDLNYSNLVFHSINSLRKYENSERNICYAFVEYDVSEGTTYTTVDNFMLNYTSKEHRPKYKALDIGVSIDQEVIQRPDVIGLVDELVKEFQLEYGSIHLYRSDKFYGNTKVRHGIFSFSTLNNKDDLLWSNNQQSLRNGFIKKLYYINYLNKSQVNNKYLSPYLRSFGEMSEVNALIDRWTLTEKEYAYLINSTDISSASILTEAKD